MSYIRNCYSEIPSKSCGSSGWVYQFLGCYSARLLLFTLNRDFSLQMMTSKASNSYICKYAEEIPEGFPWLGKLTSCCGESFCSTYVEADKGKPCARCGSASFFKRKKT